MGLTSGDVCCRKKIKHRLTAPLIGEQLRDASAVPAPEGARELAGLFKDGRPKSLLLALPLGAILEEVLSSPVQGLGALCRREMQQGDLTLPGNNGSRTDSGPAGGGRGLGSDSSEWEEREREEYLCPGGGGREGAGRGAEN